jgi:SIR2-like domain
MNPDRYYLADQEISLADVNARQKLTQRLRQYLELRNVNVLLGNGSSIPLGAPVTNDARTIKVELSQAPYKLTDDTRQGTAMRLFDLLLPNTAPAINIENLMGIVNNIATNATLLPAATKYTINTQAVTLEAAQLLDTLIKKWLYLRCHRISDPSLPDLQHHRELLRRLLLRSTTLPRAKVFTTNYDLIIEHALDSLGVVYLDGFTGTIKRTLQPQSYHYDLYYPGETTEGHVSRVDRVLHFYKLHGSINWRRSNRTIDVTIDHTAPTAEAAYGDVMIYPSPLKATEIHGYPYSEMFRHFGTHINQAQTVLIAIGYAFQDDHVNRLIYQALNIPSFTLVIVVPEIASPEAGREPGPQHEIWRLIHRVRSTRIIVITGGAKTDDKYTDGAGTIQGFPRSIMPDIAELDISARVTEEVERVNTIDQSTPASPADEPAAEHQEDRRAD